MSVETLATLLSIAAVLVSLFWFGHRQLAERRDRKRLEEHLRREKDTPRMADDSGKRTVNHLMREMGLSQERILYLSNKSSKIRRSSRKRKDGMSGDVLFEYEEDQVK